MNLSFSPQDDLGLVSYYKYPNNTDLFNIDILIVTTDPLSPSVHPFNRMMWTILQDLLKSTSNIVEKFALNELLTSPYFEFRFSRTATNDTMLAIIVIRPFKCTFIFESDSVFMRVFRNLGINQDNTIPSELRYVERWNETQNHRCIMLFNIYQMQENDNQDDSSTTNPLSDDIEVILAFGVYRSTFIQYVKTKASSLLDKISHLQYQLDSVDDVMLELGL